MQIISKHNSLTGEDKLEKDNERKIIECVQIKCN